MHMHENGGTNETSRTQKHTPKRACKLGFVAVHFSRSLVVAGGRVLRLCVRRALARALVLFGASYIFGPFVGQHYPLHGRAPADMREGGRQGRAIHIFIIHATFSDGTLSGGTQASASQVCC